MKIDEIPRDVTSWGWGQGSTAGFSTPSTTRYPSGNTSWKISWGFPSGMILSIKNWWKSEDWTCYHMLWCILRRC